jgi:hypothetical protein
MLSVVILNVINTEWHNEGLILSVVMLNVALLNGVVRSAFITN